DMRNLTLTFLGVSRPGIAGIALFAGLLWTARIFAVSLQRGLGVIFPDTDKIKSFQKMMMSLFIEGAIILFVFIIVFSSAALYLSLFVIALFVFLGYTFVPAVKPKLTAALVGTLFCIGSFTFILWTLSFIFDSEKYDILYGTLGNLLVLLVNVYFFFILFFLGAELTFTVNSFDTLLLSHFIHSSSQPKKSFAELWFTSTKGALKKYLRLYERGKVLFYKGEDSLMVYYILSGVAGVYLDESSLFAVIEQGEIFGEMGHVLSGKRSATVKAHTDMTVLAIPQLLFHDLSKYSPDANKKLITLLSERLRNTNEKLNEEKQH
ncbi:MAG: YihY/virulence factor BrkB family protein, partial [Treponema sp.]|nr:YihY/virulence factor BrkB family protein [Treponema sp.]